MSVSPRELSRVPILYTAPYFWHTRMRDNRSFGVLPSSLEDLGDDAAVVGSMDLNQIARFHPFAIEKKTLGADGSRCHLGHGAILDLRRKRDGE